MRELDSWEITGFRIRCGEAHERWLDGHENEWKYSTDGSEEMGGFSGMRQRPEIKEELKNQWG